MTDVQTKVLRNLASRSNDGVLRGPAFVAADTIDAQVARIAELEADREALITSRDMLGRFWETARTDALREVMDAVKSSEEQRCAKCGHPRNAHRYRHPFVATEAVDPVVIVQALIDKEPTT